MRRRVVLLAAATTSMVALAFVLPLALVVRELAEDKAIGQAHLEAQSLVAALGAVDGAVPRQEIVDAVRPRSPREVEFYPDPGPAPGRPGDEEATRVRRAFDGNAFTADYAGGTEILLPGVGRDGAPFVVRIRVADRLLHGNVFAAWAVLVLLGVVLSVLATAVADRLARSLVTSVGDLVATVRRLGHGDLSARAAPGGPPEVVEVADAVNNLAGRVTVMLAAERRSVGDLSHRLRTPLTALRLEVDGLRHGDERARMTASVNQLTAAVDQVIRAARRPASDPAVATDVVAVVRERMGYWAGRARLQNRAAGLTTVDGSRVVDVDADALAAAVDALVGNVFAHTAEDSALAVRVYDAGRNVVLEVSDDGPGFDAVEVDPDAPATMGSTGLGLDIVRRTVEGAGGTVAILVPAGGGCTVRATMPCRRAIGDRRRPALARTGPPEPR